MEVTTTMRRLTDSCIGNCQEGAISLSNHGRLYNTDVHGQTDSGFLHCNIRKFGTPSSLPSSLQRNVQNDCRFFLLILILQQTGLLSSESQVSVFSSLISSLLFRKHMHIAHHKSQYIHTVNHKKRATLFLIITLAFLSRFLYFFLQVETGRNTLQGS